jgi:hypothetical protein
MLAIFIPNFYLRISFDKFIIEYEIKSGSKRSQFVCWWWPPFTNFTLKGQKMWASQLQLVRLDVYKFLKSLIVQFVNVRNCGDQSDLFTV